VFSGNWVKAQDLTAELMEIDGVLSPQSFTRRLLRFPFTIVKLLTNGN